jgi:hypothetical protein
MLSQITIRPIQPADFAAWKPLWDAYNAFYGRERVFDFLQPFQLIRC